MKNSIKYILYCSILLIIIISMSRWRVVSVSKGHIFDVTEMNKIEDCQNILVLGARVYDDGKMSPILIERVMTVVDLYKFDKPCSVIVSGNEDETYAMEQYLVDSGIPKNIIYNDDAGKDTFTSMKNIRDIFNVDNVVVVTQEFHLPRAVYLGRVLEVDVKGFVAYKYPYPTRTEKYKDLLREWPAALKAVWQGEIIKN